MTSDEAANDAPAPAAGAGKASDFALKVRLGGHLEKLKQLRVEIGATRARAAEVVAEIDRLQVAAAAIEDAIAKDRG